MIKTIYTSFLLYTLLISGALKAGEWQSIAPLNTPRGGAAAVTYNNAIYVFGGITINNNVLNTVEVYSPATGAWDTTIVPPFLIPRYNASAVIFNGQIYLIGGRDAEHVFNEVEVYDPEQNTWTPVQKLRNDRESLAAAVFNDRIYAIGGQKANYSLVEEVEWYDYAENDWLEAMFNLPYPRAAHFSAVVRDTFYMFGGYYYGLTRTSYKCHADQEGYYWYPGPQFAQGRAYGATAVIDSLIYLLGGETSAGKTAVSEIFSITSGNYHPGPLLTSPRSGMAGAALGDTVFVIGGFDAANDLPMDLAEMHILSPTVLKNPETSIPGSAILFKGYPNPFNGVITLEVSVGKPDEYRLDIYTIHGQIVKRIHYGRLSEGRHMFHWDGTDAVDSGVASGIYLAAIHSSDQFERLKIVYVR